MSTRNRWFVIAVLGTLAIGAAGSSFAEDGQGPSARLIPASRISPVYPPAAFAARFDGSVTIAALVNADGTVGEVEVLESSRPNLGFEDAAARAVQQWRFEPAEQDGQPVSSYSVFRVSFGVSGPRSNQGAHFAGTYVQGGTFTGIFGAGARADGEGNHVTGSDFRREVQKVNLPPQCQGCMYDRTDLLPPPQQTVHPTFRLE